MASIETTWTDPVLGTLRWSEVDLSWKGQGEVAGARITLSVDVDRSDPTREDQLGCLKAAGLLFQAVQQKEAGIRREAALQIVEDVADQGALDPAAFERSLALEEVALHGSGELYYRCKAFFPDQVMTVFFSETAEFEQAEICEQ